MKKFRIEFGRDGAYLPIAQQLPVLRMFRVGITALYHKTFDHAMEQKTVVKMAVDQLQKIIAVNRGLIIKRYTYFSLGGKNGHNRPGRIDSGIVFGSIIGNLVFV